MRSAACQKFCIQPETNNDRLCEVALFDLCREQTAPDGHEDICACWLKDDTYKRIQSEKMKDLGLDEKSAFSQKLREDLQQLSAPPVCWYGACKQSQLRPKFEQKCPDNQFYICTQNMSNNIFDSQGGEQKHDQSCNFIQNQYNQSVQEEKQKEASVQEKNEKMTELGENKTSVQKLGLLLFVFCCVVICVLFVVVFRRSK